MIVAPVAEDLLGYRSARVDLAAFLSAVRLTKSLQRNEPLVQLLPADAERVALALIRSGDKTVEGHRDDHLQLAHRAPPRSPAEHDTNAVAWWRPKEGNR
jgi:hypothetical protein